MTKRTLRLKSETLTELTSDDLLAVVGAQPDLSGPTCPLNECISNLFNTCRCATGNC